MKLKITRIFCVFLLMIALIAFGLLFTLVAEEQAFSQLMWFGLASSTLVSIGYGYLLLRYWAKPDKLLVFAGVYAVVLLLLLNTLGLT
ncbi:hypothetical protein FUA23_06225 [Neolewinella aurantiaca]|uniref:Uncharacterized protein n=1 Tax=Neolewinella aurantiaca TaxID=2602767 RepID=A0A5C7FR41_9BACT|nr:hypothetical protein [Neolewinella aurantiaca]TXF90383.1 hypothetical protein FUA23_06225 [Neolewinella aurantiaca]